MDLGACPKSHTERLKTEFLAAREADPNNPIFARFQMEYESNIFAFVDECDRRIRAAHRRLEKTPEENAKTTRKTYTNAIPAPPTAGRPACCAVHAVMSATEIAMPVLDAMSSLRRPSRSMKRSPDSAAAIIIGVWRALSRSWVRSLVIPAVFATETALLAQCKRGAECSRLTHEGEIVAGRREIPLSKEGHACDEEGAVARGARVEEVAEVPPPLVGALCGDDLEHLLHLECDDGRVRVSVSVVSDQDLFRPIGASLADVPASAFQRYGLGSMPGPDYSPSWCLRNQPHEAEHQYGG